MLADAALRMVAPGRRHPLIVLVPRAVDGTDGSTFWSGLDPAWLNLTTVADATDRPATQVDPDSLTYPADQETAELPSAVFSEVEQLIAGGRHPAEPADRGRPGGGRRRATRRSPERRTTTGSTRTPPRPGWPARAAGSTDSCGRSGSKGPPAVTLSSADGSFAVTVTNRLDRTVTVQIAADSVDDEVEVDVGDPLVLAADSRTTIVLDAHPRASACTT